MKRRNIAKCRYRELDIEIEDVITILTLSSSKTKTLSQFDPPLPFSRDPVRFSAFSWIPACFSGYLPGNYYFLLGCSLGLARLFS